MEQKHRIVGSLDDGYFDAMCETRRVGYLWFCRQSDTEILLSDIQVFNTVPIASNWLGRWIPALRPRSVSYRHGGIGTELMRTFLEQADAAKVSRIFGSVTEADLTASPFLKTWYPTFGFVFMSPDSECISNAQYKIQRLVKTQI